MMNRERFVIEHFDANGECVGSLINGSLNERVDDLAYETLLAGDIVLLYEGGWWEAYIPID